MKKKLFAVAAFLLVFGCSSEKKHRASSILELKELGKLATVEYLVSKVVRARDDQTWYKIGERKILISCKASIRAGVDLSKIGAQQIKQSENSISIQLPPPEIISFSLPPEKIKVEYVEVGIFRHRFNQSEIEGIMVQAERQIRRQMDSLNILQKAQESAATFVRHFFQQAGFEEVTVQL